jgi:hypothetical protein
MKNQKYNLGLIFSVFMMIAFSGCRFGNHEDPNVNLNNITNSELFFTQVKTFQTEADFSDTTFSQNTAASLIDVPTDLLDVFTSTVYWDTYDQSAAVFPTDVDASGQINTEMDSTPTTLYLDPSCQTYTQTFQVGNLDRTAPGTTILPGDTTATPVAGHLNLTVTWQQQFAGNCAADLQTLANCYQNSANCTTDELSRAKMFDLFVAQTSALNITNASKLITLVYVAHFD